MTNLHTPAEVADLLGCTVTDLRNWRNLPADHPRRLQSTIVACRHHYDLTTIYEWLNRPSQATYREIVLASFCPEHIRTRLFPRALAAGPRPLPAQPTDLSQWSLIE